MIDFHAQGRCATAVCDNPITTGSVGIAAHFRFSAEWDDLQKVSVFRAGESSVDVVLTDDVCTVPPDVLTVPGLPLMIGVYGMSTDGTVVIPTVWARAAIIKAGTIPSGIDPTEPAPSWQAQVQEMASEALETANTVKNAAEAGEFDGADGSGIWYTTGRVSGDDNPFVLRRNLIGREGATVQVHDLLLAPDVRDEGEPTTLYEITSVGTACALNRLCKMQGKDGYSPAVTITDITGGHRITITDEAHPDGQSFDVMDGSGGGGGTSDYNDLSNKPQIGGVTLSGNKSLTDLGIAPAGAYVKPSDGIPKTDLATDVQTSLVKADTALQEHQSLAAYRTAADQDTIDAAQDTEIAGKLSTTGNAYRAASIPMGELDSTSTATVMTATVPGITELRDGVCVWLTNGVIASAAGVTLNINSLGAKPIYNSLSGAVVTTTFVAASTYLFVYNSTRVTGGCWDMVYGYDTNTTYTPVKLGFGYATCSTAEAIVSKTAALSSYTLTTGGIVAVKFTNAVHAGATLNINSKGAKAIYYHGAAITAGVIKAGDTVTMIYSTYYHVLSIDRENVSAFNNDAGYLTDTTVGASADNWLGDALAGIDAENVPVFLYDGQNGVYISRRPQDLASAFQSQMKMNFALVVPPNYNSYPVLFTPSKFDTTTGELHLTGIVGGVLYEATLLPGADPTGQSADLCMVGTMTTTNLALPSAQGVSF